MKSKVVFGGRNFEIGRSTTEARSARRKKV